MNKDSRKRRIVVPVDPSHDESIKALSFVRDQLGDTEVFLCQVIAPTTPSAPGTLLGATTDPTKHDHCRAALSDLAATLDLTPAKIDIRIGSPAQEIAAFAEEVHADLIVMPSHGRSGLARAFLGSVAEVVVRHANCSVLVLKL